MEGKCQITSLDTWNLYVYDSFHVVTPDNEKCSWQWEEHIMVSWSMSQEYQVIKLAIKICSSTIIETIKHECGLNPTLAFAYFYFDFKDPSKQKYRNLISSLIIQLSWRFFKGIPSALRELYRQNMEGKQPPTPEALFKTLKELCRPFTHTYIVLDALDECTGTERSDVLGVIETVVGWGFDNLHLLVTSQKQPEIKRRLESLNCHQVDLGLTPISGDIQICVCDMLARDESFRHWRDKEKKLIEHTLVKGANGM